MTQVAAQLDLFTEVAGSYLILLIHEGTVVNTGGDILTEQSNGYFTADVQETLETNRNYAAKVTKDGNTIYTGWLLLSRSNVIGDQDIPVSTETSTSVSITPTVTYEGTPLSGVRIDLRNDGGVSLGNLQTTNAQGQVTFHVEPNTSYQIVTIPPTNYETPNVITLTDITEDQTPSITLTQIEGASNNDLDLSGFKRVKTKHLEIETHNPKDVQEARDKERTTLPCFCDVDACVGRNK